jgi:RND family efflux transporter MFP subunit
MEPNRTTSPDLSALRIDASARQSGGSKGSRWIRWFAAGIGVLLIVSAAVFAFKGRAPVVEVVAAHTGSEAREVLLNASGYVTPRRRATIAAKITGRVTQMIADEGMHVNEGQVLAVLDNSDTLVRLKSAEADRNATAAALKDLQVQLTNAERELHRSEILEKQGVSSVQALDLARTAADSLRAKISLTDQQTKAADERIRVAQQDLDNCTVRAPYTGIVVSKDAQVGEMVSPVSAGGGFTRTGIATIVDMKSLEIEVDVNESYIARVREAMPVTAILDAYPDWKIPGKVRTVIPTADRQKATVKVRISFVELDPRILPDMGVKVTFLGDEAKGVRPGATTLLVPKSAVRSDNGSSIVYVYHDGRVERRAVRLGGATGSDQQIIAGLTAGDQVVVSPPEGIHDSTRVELKK